MPNPASARRSTWFSKFFECLYFFVGAAMVFFMVLNTFFFNYLKAHGEAHFVRLYLYTCVFFILISIAYATWWHLNEKRADFDSDIKHAWMRGALRYFIAFDVSLYGFGKIFKTQFATLYSQNDTPVGNLSGLELTWNYFGYSHSFAVILGLLQIGGAILLLFRGTSLLGVCVLLPVMLNIVLINIFYSIAIGAFGNSLIITIGLLYLLCLRWSNIKALVFNDTSGLPKIKLGSLKPVLKLLTIAAAFGCIYYFVANKPPAAFAGKWKVLELKRNGDVVNKNDWQINPDSWCYVYMEETGRVALSPNPYIFDQTRARWADYRYDAGKHHLQLIFSPDGVQTASDTSNVAVSIVDRNNMEWHAIIDRDTLQIRLVKEEKIKQ